MNICLVMVFGVGLACGGGDKAKTISEYCEVSKTITASRRDTPETRAQVRRENAKRRKLCK